MMSREAEAILERAEARAIGRSMEQFGIAMSGKTLPYPWCIGAPTMVACLQAGYCQRDPSCGD